MTIIRWSETNKNTIAKPQESLTPVPGASRRFPWEIPPNSDPARHVVVVGMGDMEIADKPNIALITYSLGSCIGVAMYDPVAGVGGMIHCMLPLSKKDEAKSHERPSMYVDTGLVLMLTKLYQMGASRDRIVTTMAGAAQILEQGAYFKIGDRNHAIARKILWKNNLLISGEDVGGLKPRTMSLDMQTGKTHIRIGENIMELG